jgi:hypothetical protein
MGYLKGNPPKKSNMLPEVGGKPTPGQVWEIKTKYDSLFILLLEMSTQKNIFNAVPVFRWTEKAGPDDLFIPRDFVGFPAIVSFELEFSVDSSALHECKGLLAKNDFNHILGAKRLFGSGKKGADRKFSWGWSYLDEMDLRYKFHQEMAELIGKIQVGLIKKAYSVKKTNVRSVSLLHIVKDWLNKIKVPENIIAFTELVALPAAASSEDTDVMIPVISISENRNLATAEAKSNCWALGDAVPGLAPESEFYLTQRNNPRTILGKGVVKQGIKFVPENISLLGNTKNLVILVV